MVIASERWISWFQKKVRIKSVCLIVVASLLVATAPKGSAEEAPVYHCHDNQEMKIALTFDDGPHPHQTPRILDILNAHGIKATFFIVGENAVNYPSVVERIWREGHEIGNHTFSHDKIDVQEIESCENVIYELTEHKTKLFRPPQGFIDSTVKSASSHLGYEIILWSIDTKDWARTPPTTIIQNVLNNLEAGSIILMHDYIGYNSPTPEALEMLIPRIKEQGYHFVTVSELLGTK